VENLNELESASRRPESGIGNPEGADLQLGLKQARTELAQVGDDLDRCAAGRDVGKSPFMY
jgi:hypothetical protein